MSRAEDVETPPWKPNDVESASTHFEKKHDAFEFEGFFLFCY